MELNTNKPNPICAKCQLEMRVQENDFAVRDPEAHGFPSTFWWGDLFQCPGCEIEIVSSFGVGLSPETAKITKKQKGQAMLFHHNLEDQGKEGVEQRV